jgi:CubicO group peptidase (beta-lactamase class C family)
VALHSRGRFVASVVKPGYSIGRDDLAAEGAQVPGASRRITMDGGSRRSWIDVQCMDDRSGLVTNSTVASPAGASSSRFEAFNERVRTLLAAGIDDGALSGCVLLASERGQLKASVALGQKAPKRHDSTQPVEAMSFDTVFDLGALTQAICTATLVMRLLTAGKIEVTDRASRFLQALGVGQKSPLTLAHLLAHASGFPVAPSVYEELVKANAGPRLGILTSSGAKQYAYNYFHNLPLKYEPGQRQVPSDVNYIVLGEICEIITGLSLEKAFTRYVAAPFQLRSLNFIDLALMRRKNLAPMVELFAPSGECSKRGRVLAGEVWDENTWAMGGVAGHSGLFGTASDVHAWGSGLVAAYRGDSNLIARDVVRTFFTPELQGLKAGWKLCVSASSKEAGFVEAKAAPDAVCVSSEGGCSVYIDPARELVAVLLSNAGYSGVYNRKFVALRSELHTALLEVV